MKREDRDCQTIYIALGFKFNTLSLQKCICIFSLLHVSSTSKGPEVRKFFLALLPFLVRFVCHAAFAFCVFLSGHVICSPPLPIIKSAFTSGIHIMKLVCYSLCRTSDTSSLKPSRFLNSFQEPALKKVF